MGFESLLGNDRVKENLRLALRRGQTSHFYLISGAAGAGKRTLARLLAAGILCQQENAPCLACATCRKVMANTHPDVITVDDPEKKTVSVELIRQARADLFIQPNEGSHKIYIIPRGQDMLLPAQNALLKVLEEPPAYGVFLLLTDHAERLLPTVRSRAVELALTALPQGLLRQTLAQRFPGKDSEQLQSAVDRSGGFLGQALALLEQENTPEDTRFATAYAVRDTMALLEILVPMEKWKREQLLGTLTQWLTLLQNALVCRSGLSAPTPEARKIAAGRGSQELMAGVTHIKKAMQYTQANVSPAAVCGYLEWALQ